MSTHNQTRPLRNKEILDAVLDLIEYKVESQKTAEYIHQIYNNPWLDVKYHVIDKAQQEWAIAQGYYTQLEEEFYESLGK